MISVFQLRYNQLQIVKDRKKNMKKRFWTRFVLFYYYYMLFLLMRIYCLIKDLSFIYVITKKVEQTIYNFFFSFFSCEVLINNFNNYEIT